MLPRVAHALASRNSDEALDFAAMASTLDASLHQFPHLLRLDQLQAEDAADALELLQRAHAELTTTHHASVADEAFLANASSYNDWVGAPLGEARTQPPPLPPIQVSAEASVRHWSGAGRGWHSQILRLFLFHYVCATRSGLIRGVEEMVFDAAPAEGGIPDDPIPILVELRAPKRLLANVTHAIETSRAVVDLGAWGVPVREIHWTQNLEGP